MDNRPLRVLVVATRPPFPPMGGGSATLHALLRALPEAGIDVRVVALASREPSPDAPPYAIRTVEAAPRPWAAVAPALASRTPSAVRRYTLGPLAAKVEAEIEAFAPDVVHLEQLHLAWLGRRLAGRIPVVLREQNVESLLLARVGALLPAPLRWACRWESGRTRRFERRACEAAALVAAISEDDADALRALAPAARVAVLPATVAFEGPPTQRLRGSPPFLCLGSFDWLPNRDGARWLLREVWPRLRRLAPGGVLHLAGPGSTTLGRDREEAVERHGRVVSPSSLYDPAAVVLIPLRAGSGVRVRLLEAWAAGSPAVVSPCAAEGLVHHDGDGALLAPTPQEFAEAAARLAADPALRERLVEQGRARLVAHEPRRVAALARRLYLEASASGPTAGTR
jgi:glycosyltransferase involved in cell wall biosynthesis